MPGDLLFYRKKKKRRKKRPAWRPQPLTIDQILAWADAHQARTGKWPNAESGRVQDAVNGTWLAVDMALRNGRRGLASGSSLARLLQAKRGVRNIKNLPDFDVEQILRWADAHHAEHGEWPTPDSGDIPQWQHDTWSSIDSALRIGLRSLPGHSSLPRLLAKHRGRRNRKRLPPYRIEQILVWADGHFRQTGVWPNRNSGPIADAPGETWNAVDAALKAGIRGLPAGNSLAKLLAEKRKSALAR